MKTNTPYTPIYFLSALGSGGLVVTFFMYIMFMTKYSGPIPTFDTLITYFSSSDIIYMGLISFAIIGMVFFGILHFKLLIGNIISYNKFKKTKEFKKLKKSNAEVSLMAIPLTYAMSLNVGFMLAAISIPNLWSVIEYIFPFAIIGFLIIGIYGLKIFGEYFSRLVTKGDFDFVKNNNLSQMISVFAFSMVAVGLAAPTAMSTNQTTSAIAFGFSLFFITIAVFLAFIKLFLGFKSMFKQGINEEASPTIRIMIPIITVLGIAVIRQDFALIHEFGVEIPKMNFFILTTVFISLQLIFGYLGHLVMKKNGYFKKYVNGKEKSATSYALICPGVALTVMGFFFINRGLVYPGILEKFSIIYFLFTIPLIYLQYITIKLLFKLNKKLLK